MTTVYPNLLRIQNANVRLWAPGGVQSENGGLHLHPKWHKRTIPYTHDEPNIKLFFFWTLLESWSVASQQKGNRDQSIASPYKLQRRVRHISDTKITRRAFPHLNGINPSRNSPKLHLQSRTFLPQNPRKTKTLQTISLLLIKTSPPKPQVDLRT